MGWEDDNVTGRRTGVVAQLCGHTHRRQFIMRAKMPRTMTEIRAPGLPPLINVGTEPFRFEVDSLRG